MNRLLSALLVICVIYSSLASTGNAQKQTAPNNQTEAPVEELSPEDVEGHEARTMSEVEEVMPPIEEEPLFSTESTKCSAITSREDLSEFLSEKRMGLILFTSQNAEDCPACKSFTDEIWPEILRHGVRCKLQCYTVNTATDSGLSISHEVGIEKDALPAARLYNDLSGVPSHFYARQDAEVGINLELLQVKLMAFLQEVKKDSDGHCLKFEAGYHAYTIDFEVPEGEEAKYVTAADVHQLEDHGIVDDHMPILTEPPTASGTQEKAAHK